jgi:CheY-like chemotaxis protein
VADDHALSLRVFEALLRRMGLTAVTVAADGRAAVEAWTLLHPDLVFLDLHMPVMDGPEAARVIRQREALDPGLRRAFICAVTADATTLDRARCLECGMDDFLAKPLQPGQIARVLERVRHRQAARVGWWRPAASSIDRAVQVRRPVVVQ